jgi:hypothetical protein
MMVLYFLFVSLFIYTIDFVSFVKIFYIRFDIIGVNPKLHKNSFVVLKK